MSTQFKVLEEICYTAPIPAAVSPERSLFVIVLFLFMASNAEFLVSGIFNMRLTSFTVHRTFVYTFASSRCQMNSAWWATLMHLS